MKILITIAAALVMNLVSLAGVAAQPVMSQPVVTGFDVVQVPQLSPGTELEFTVWGTPGAQATLQIDGSQRALPMYEQNPGIYKAIYTLNLRDRIEPGASVSVNLRRGNRVVAATLDERLVTGAAWPTSPAAGAVQIERFEVRHGDLRSQPRNIDFRLVGTPGGRASVKLAGAAQRIRLFENNPGVYSATYVVQNNDRIDSNEPVVARLWVNGSAPVTASSRDLDGNRLQRFVAAQCADCATVRAVNEIEVAGDGNYIGGTVAGGILGAVLGSQVGDGSGRTAAQVIGTVGGAAIGRQLQRRNDKRTVYEVHFTMRDDGSQRTLQYADRPTFRVGDRVVLRDGQAVVDNRRTSN